MKNQERIIKDYIVESEGANTLRVKIYYNIGGHNYFTYKTETRGIYLSVSPLTISKGEGHQTISYTGFSGTKMLVKEMKRFSQKTFDNFNPSKEDLDRVIKYVVEDNNLKLEDNER